MVASPGRSRECTSSKNRESLPGGPSAPLSSPRQKSPIEFFLFDGCDRVLGGGAGLFVGLAHAHTAEPHETAWICRPTETDLVPCPRMAVERRQRHAHHHRPGPLDVELFPAAAAELSVGEPPEDRFPGGR